MKSARIYNEKKNATISALTASTAQWQRVELYGASINDLTFSACFPLDAINQRRDTCLELDRLSVAHPHINSDAIEWQTHQRDIWLTDSKCHLYRKINTMEKQSEASYTT